MTEAPETPQAPPPVEETPIINAPLELFIDDLGRVVVGRGGGLHTAHPNEGIAFIGRVYEQTGEGPQNYTLKPVILDIAQPHRIFISGKSGSGKSYTLGVMIEEIQKAQMGVACLVVDIMGVFTASKEPNHDKKELEILKKYNLAPAGVPNVRIFVPLGFTPQIPRNLYDEAFSFKPNDLELDDWLYTFNINFNSAMGLCLSEVMNIAKKQYPAGFSIPDIVKIIQNNPQITDPTKGFAVTSRKALISKLMAAEHWGIFSAKGTDLSDICRENTCAILDVSPLSENLRALVTGILARKVLEARRLIARGGEVEPDEKIPITWMIVDEAHNFAPAKGTTPALEALVRLAKEGRHPGANLVLATQQPGATSNEIISQCDILITHNLSYDEDIRTFKAKAPCDVPKEMADTRFIRGLAVGMGILAVQSMKISRAFVVQIRPRLAQHGGKELLPAGLGGKPDEVKVKAKTEVTAKPEETAPQKKTLPPFVPAKAPEETPEEVPEEEPLKAEKEFYPEEGATSKGTNDKSASYITEDLKGSAELHLPEDLALNVVERSLTYDEFFPKTGPFETQTARFKVKPRPFLKKAEDILEKNDYTVKVKTHETGAWLVLAEHDESLHSIFFAATFATNQLIVAFRATTIPKNAAKSVLSLKKFVKMLE